MKKFIIRLLVGVGITLGLIFVVSNILVLKGKLNIPKVQASPATCTVSDDVEMTGNLNVGKKTNIVNPLNPWTTVDCTNFDASGETCDFTLDTNYSAVMLAIAADVESDALRIGFFDAAGGGGNKIGELFMGSAVCEAAFGSFYRPSHSTVMLPTTAKSTKILGIGGCTRGTTITNNIIIMGYFK